MTANSLYFGDNRTNFCFGAVNSNHYNDGLASSQSDLDLFAQRSIETAILRANVCNIRSNRGKNIFGERQNEMKRGIG